MSSRTALILATALMASNSMSFDDEFMPRVRRTKSEPKNKFNLTNEEIELLETMTPKEKKKFLRGKL